MDDDEEWLTRKPALRGSQRLAWWIAGAMTGWLLLALLTGSVLVGLFCDLASGALVAGVAVARRPVAGLAAATPSSDPDVVGRAWPFVADSLYASSCAVAYIGPQHPGSYPRAVG